MKADHHPFESRGPRRSERLRQRAAWMYFVEEMTQSAIADALGVGRVTVVRMLAEAKALGEVRIALSRGHAELGGLEAALCTTYGLRGGAGRAALLPRGRRDGADRRRARRVRVVAPAQRHEDRARLGPHAEPVARAPARAFAARPQRRVARRRGHALRAGQSGRVPIGLRARLQRRMLPHSLAGPGRQPGDEDRADRALRPESVYDFANALDAVVVSVGSLGPEATIARFELIGEADRQAMASSAASANCCATSTITRGGSSIIRSASR